MKWLKNVKLSSKSCFSPQELQNLSRDTHMKRINPQQLPNLTQDTNMKRLNYVKLASQSGFRPHELPKLSQETITSIFVFYFRFEQCYFVCFFRCLLLVGTSFVIFTRTVFFQLSQHELRVINLNGEHQVA